MKRISEFNDKVMDGSANVVGLPWTFYVIVVLAVGSLLIHRPTDVQGWLLWGCTILFQGAALTPIQYTGAKTSKKIDKMYEWMQAKEQESSERNDNIHELVTDLHKKHVTDEHHAHRKVE